MDVDSKNLGLGLTFAQAMMLNAAITFRYGGKFTSPNYKEQEIIKSLYNESHR